MIKATDEQPCLNKTEILLEQFIPDHVFVYITKGSVNCYDGNKTYAFKSGEYFLARKNRLARYHNKNGSDFARLMFCFEEDFVKKFQAKYGYNASGTYKTDTFVSIKPTRLIPDFIRSLRPYINDSGKIDIAFEGVKFEELLIILLQNQPELAGLFFDYARPEKIDLEKFMNDNFSFNVNIERFAYLTGRSLSAFKRDFKMIFNETPNHWLVQRRLQEAYYLISKKNKKASEIYLDLGFEDLSHFSFAFKKRFGLRPTELAEQKIEIS